MKVAILLAYVAIALVGARMLFVLNELGFRCDAELVIEPEPLGWRGWSLSHGGTRLEFEETRTGWRVTARGTEGLFIAHPMSPCPELKIHSRDDRIVVGETASWLGGPKLDVEEFVIAFRRVPKKGFAIDRGPSLSGVSPFMRRVVVLGADLLALGALVLAQSRARRYLLLARELRNPLSFAEGVRGADGGVRVAGVGSVAGRVGDVGPPGPVLVRVRQTTQGRYRTPPAVEAGAVVFGTREAACARCARNAHRWLASALCAVVILGLASWVVLSDASDLAVWRGPPEQISCGRWHPFCENHCH